MTTFCNAFCEFYLSSCFKMVIPGRCKILFCFLQLFSRISRAILWTRGMPRIQSFWTSRIRIWNNLSWSGSNLFDIYKYVQFRQCIRIKNGIQLSSNFFLPGHILWCMGSWGGSGSENKSFRVPLYRALEFFQSPLPFLLNLGLPNTQS